MPYFNESDSSLGSSWAMSETTSQDGSKDFEISNPRIPR